MITQEVLDYIKEQLSQGRSREEIKQTLKQQGGWEDKDLEEAFSKVETPASVSTTPEVENLQENAGGTPSEDNLINKKSKWASILVAILALLVIGGGGAFAYFKFFQAPKPSKVLRTSFKNLAGVDSFSYEGVYEGLVETKQGQSIDMSINAKGMTNTATSAEEIRGKHNLGLDIKIDDEEGNMMGIAAQVEVRILVGKLYLALKKAPSFGPIDLSRLENQWITGDLNFVESSGIKEEDFSKTQSSVSEVVKKNWPVVVIEDYGEKSLEGREVYHYGIGVDREKALSLVEEINRIAENNEQMNTMEPERMQEMKDFLKKVEDKVLGEVWIEKERKLPVKFVLSLTGEEINSESTSMFENVFMNAASAFESIPGKGTMPVSPPSNMPEFSSGSMSMELKLSNFNDLVNVSTPMNAKSFEEIMKGMMGGLKTNISNKTQVIDDKN